MIIPTLLTKNKIYPPIVNPTTGTKVVFFGDSITTGTGASVPAKKWTRVLCSAKGWTEINWGMPGTTMIYAYPYDPANRYAMPETYTLSLIPTWNNTYRYLFFAYGINDVGLNYPNYTSTQFYNDYVYVLNAALAKGWPYQQIIAVNIYYVDRPNCWAHYLGYAPGADETRYQLFRNTVRSLPKNKCRVIDPYYYVVNNVPGAKTIDDIHPNDDGHYWIAQCFIQNLI